MNPCKRLFSLALVVAVALLSASCSLDRAFPDRFTGLQEAAADGVATEAMELQLLSVTPAAGPKAGGIRLTLRGTNFASGAGVLINGTPAADVVVLSGTLMTALLPPYTGDWSYVSVSVTNPDGQSVKRDGIFSYYADQFQLSGALIDAGRTVDIAIAQDFNLDGNPDIIIASTEQSGGTSFSLLIGDGSGGAGIPLVFPANPKDPSQTAGDIQADDINGDKKPDLIFRIGASIAVRLGDGQGKFGELLLSSSGQFSGYMIGDFNGDKKPDAVINLLSQPAVMLGDGTGRFGAPIATSGIVRVSGVADFDGDGAHDLVTGMSNGISVHLSDGWGGFRAAVTTMSQIRDGVIVIGDWNGDNKPDIAFSEYSTSSLRVLLGNGRGGFTVFPEVIDLLAYGVRTASDFNGDGQLDLAVGSNGGFDIVLGIGLGSFTRVWKSPFPQISAARFVLADFNTDGAMDVISYSGKMSTLRISFGDGAGRIGIPSSISQDVFVSKMLTVDFNGDHIDDTISRDNNGYEARLGNANQSFDTGFSLGSKADFPRSVGDFNGDGHIDILMTKSKSPDPGYRSQVLFGNGDGTFTAAPTSLDNIFGFTCGLNCISKSVDVNGDGLADLLSIGSGVSVALSDGRGGFVQSQYAMIVAPYANPDLLIGDWNGDGVLDVAARCGVDGRGICFQIGDGKGRFRNFSHFLTGSTISSVGIADLNSDHLPDLAVVSGKTSVYLGKFDGGFELKAKYQLDGKIEIVDLNGDLVPDLSFARDDFPSATVLLGKGDGEFLPGGSYGLNNSGLNQVIADLNGDRRPDWMLSDGTVLFNLSK